MPTDEQPARRWTALHLWQIQPVRDLLLIASIVGVIWLGYAMRSVTTPLLIALGLAYLFEPLIGWSTRRWGLSRTTVVSSLLLVLVGTVAIVLALTAPLVIRQAASMVDDVRRGSLVRSIERLESVLPEAMRSSVQDIASRLGLVHDDAPAGGEPPEAAPASGDSATAANGAIEPGAPADAAVGAPATQAAVPPTATASRVEEPHPQATGSASTEVFSPDSLTELQLAEVRRVVREELLASSEPVAHVGGGTTGIGASSLLAFARRGWDTAASVVGVLVTIGLLSFLIPFYFFFFSIWYPTVTAFVGSMIPRRNREATLELLGKMDAAVAGFVRGRLVISAIVGFVLGVGWLAVGVPYSIVLGVVLGVFNLVPYLSGIGWPIAVGLMVFGQLALPPEQRHQWGWIWWIGAPTAVFFLAQALDGWVLTPVIAGKATDLDPVTIVVAVIAGGSLGGVYGMLLAIPAAACMKILLREVFLPRVKRWVEGRASDPLPM